MEDEFVTNQAGWGAAEHAKSKEGGGRETGLVRP